MVLTNSSLAAPQISQLLGNSKVEFYQLPIYKDKAPALCSFLHVLSDYFVAHCHFGLNICIGICFALAISNANTSIITLKNDKHHVQ